MLPVIALVGRPNVGKSTLFNRLTQTQDALVADFPGLTRDRQYGRVSLDRDAFVVVDTGGMGVDDVAVDVLMSKQSALALQEAHLIFLLVDARSGLTPLDEQIARYLRKLGKPVWIVINKIDGLDEASVAVEFQSLGFLDQYAISASHGRGIQALLQQSLIFLKKTFSDIYAAEYDGEEEDSQSIHIAFIGRPNVGKSTLINRILGEERVVVYDMPGTTRDSIVIPFERQGQVYRLIDTAGVRRRSRVDEKIEKFSIVKTLQAIKKAHVCLLLIDGREGLTDQDLHLLQLIISAGKALVLLVNKWDGLTLEHKKQVQEAIERRLYFADFAKIRYISALHGSGVGLLFDDILDAYHSATQAFSTPKLTRLLEEMVEKHPPPLVNRRRIKLRYAHAGGKNPPVIVIHGNQLNALPDAYKRYLNKAYTTALNLVGTPLKLEFNQGENPYAGRKNKLTDRQVKQRKRLFSFIKRS